MSLTLKKSQPQNLQFGLRSQIECSGFVPFWQNMPIRETFNFALPRTSLTLELYRQAHCIFTRFIFGRSTPRYLERVSLGNLHIFFAAID
jgi:hypothetical protein